MNGDFSNESIGFLLSLTSRKMIQMLTQQLKEFDITVEQFSVLNQLHKQDGINQKEIAVRSAKDQPTIARILDLLFKKELIEKRMSESDRRAFIVFLTEKGKSIVQKTIPIEQGMVEEALKGIDSVQIDQLQKVLLKLNENIENIMSHHN